MARGNRPQKPVERLAFQRGGRAQKRTALIPPVVPDPPIGRDSDGAFKWPAPPKGLDAVGRSQWNRMGKAFAAGVFDFNGDFERLRSYVWKCQLRRRIEKLAEDEALHAKLYVREVDDEGEEHFVAAFPALGLAYGSQGQLVEHPWISELERLTKLIEKDEEQLGFTPLARMRLLGSAAGAANSANRALKGARDLAGQGRKPHRMDPEPAPPKGKVVDSEVVRDASPATGRARRKTKGKVAM